MKRLFRNLGIGLLAIAVLCGGYVILTGNTYIFFLLKHTILKGRLGPTIDEYNIYHNRIVEKGQPIEWLKAADYNRDTLTSEELAYHKKMETAAFIIVKNGGLLHEQYWRQYNDSSMTNSWSMAKSIISHLVGCALKDGLITSVNDPIGKYLPEFSAADATVEDLLNMSSGYDFDENYLNPFSYPAKSLYGTNLREAHKGYKQVEKPGQRFDYQSANTQILGFLIMEVTGKSLSAYASEKLWKPIGAEHPALWSLDNINGVEKAFCCFNTNARDFAKFGLLYLQHGIVGNDTLISNEYYQKCTKPATHLTDHNAPNKRYGYHWWDVQLNGENIFYARGIDGQYIFVLPVSNLVIVRLGQKRPTARVDGHPEDVLKYLYQGIRIAGIATKDQNYLP
jgi:CubicO group peptidase (beta-lactamase class C family)